MVKLLINMPEVRDVRDRSLRISSAKKVPIRTVGLWRRTINFKLLPISGRAPKQGHLIVRYGDHAKNLLNPGWIRKLTKDRRPFYVIVAGPDRAGSNASSNSARKEVLAAGAIWRPTAAGMTDAQLIDAVSREQIDLEDHLQTLPPSPGVARGFDRE